MVSKTVWRILFCRRPYGGYAVVAPFSYSTPATSVAHDAFGLCAPQRQKPVRAGVEVSAVIVPETLPCRVCQTNCATSVFTVMPAAHDPRRTSPGDAEALTSSDGPTSSFYGASRMAWNPVPSAAHRHSGRSVGSACTCASPCSTTRWRSSCRSPCGSPAGLEQRNDVVLVPPPQPGNYGAGNSCCVVLNNIPCLSRSRPLSVK